MNRSDTKVFVSYSHEDRKDVLEAVRHLEVHFRNRCDFSYWDQSLVPGEEDWKCIFDMIEQSDVVLPFLIRSRDGTKIAAIESSLSVGIEIGYAVAKKKRIIPVVLLGQGERSRLGAIGRCISVSFDYNNPFLLSEELSKCLPYDCLPPNPFAKRQR